jgi:uncharacterized protein
MRIDRLIWDAGNIIHIARHGVVPDEVEEVCYGDPLFQITYANRFLVTGLTKAGRMLSVVLDPEEEEGTYYVVTARSASQKERRLYQQQKGGGTS